MRRTVQALSLLAFTALFALATYRLPDWLPADIYLRIDPLLGFSALLASREMIARVLWSLILIGATLVVGRFFCGWVCPLGVAIDGADFLLFRKIRRARLKADAALRQSKYVLLVLFFAAAAAGVALVYLMDPIALLTRFYTFFLYPLVTTAFNLLLDLLRPLLQGLGWVTFSHLHHPQPLFYMTAVTFLLFATVIGLSRMTPRFWCRYLCPLGALLSLLSPLGLFRRRVGSECNRCMACRRGCPMGAIGDDPLKTATAECIQCRECADLCPQRAITFPAGLAKGGEYSGFDLSRRGFVSSVGGGLTLGFLSLQTPFAVLQGRKELIRPPGALPEAGFLRSCIRCGECMKSCVTNTLQPSFWETGLLGLWTPKLELRMAACEPNCNVCGKVCPTQAIRSLSLEEKTHARIGTAVLRKETCLVWAQNKLCLICDEICPYNAIVFRPVDGYRRPFVIPSRCNGCGYCEQRCPVRGESAIVVMTDGEIRLAEGSYVAEAKRLQLEFKPDPGDDRYLLDGAGLKVDEGAKEEKPAPAANPVSGMPKGFL